MSSNFNHDGGSLANVSDGSAVWIVSHDMDSYEMISLVLRRDFGIKSIRSWFLQDEKGKKEFAGLRFSEFLGRKVEGYFCSPDALILSGDFEKDECSLIKGLTVVQLVPDFHSYKSICRVLGNMLGNEHISAKALYTDDALAQQLAEGHLLNLIGLFMSASTLPGNPIPPNLSGSDLQRHVRESKLLLESEAIFRVLKELRIGYGLMKSGEAMFGLENANSIANKFTGGVPKFT